MDPCIIRHAGSGSAGDVEMAKYFMEKWVCNGDDDTDNSLHWTAHCGDVKRVQFLIKRGKVCVNVANIDGRTPLMFAACNGFKNIAAILIEAGADVHRKDARKVTALHFASFNGRTQVVKLLLGQPGLDLNAQNTMGETPLHKACQEGHQVVTRLLLEAGADVTIKDNRNETALSRGIREERLTSADINLFIQRGGFFEDCDYMPLYHNPCLRIHLLQDKSVCTQSIVNRYNHQLLHALKGSPFFTNKLPVIDTFKLNDSQVDEVKNFVWLNILADTLFNIIWLRPKVLKIMCVESLLSRQSGTKRSAPLDFDGRALSCKILKTQHNKAVQSDFVYEDET